MADNGSRNGGPRGNGSVSGAGQRSIFGSRQTAQKGRISEKVIKEYYRNVPISLYGLKDKLIDITSNASFIDTAILIFAFLVTVSAFNFYPLSIVVLLLLILFLFTLYNPFVGLIIYTIIVFPIFMYQMPVLAWAFILPASVLLMFGYMHYRIAAFSYLLVGLAFSPFGMLFEVPAFVFAILTVGSKRAITLLAVALLLVITTSGVTGLQNYGYIMYNATAAHVSTLASFPSIALLDTPSKPGFSIFSFESGLSQTLSSFVSPPVTGQISSVFVAVLSTLFVNPLVYLAQAAVLVVMAILIDAAAITIRSKYKGTMSSAVGILYPASYVLLLKLTGAPGGYSYILPFVSFIISPLLFFMFEYYDVNMVRALEVKKQDIRMRFGEAFEDLAGGNVSETFDNIGNYDATKKELKEAIISPIEERSISRAYNVQPTKGILFFGPPGTGKTLMMRALANEIHAGFFYVKASNLISAYPGESARMVSNIFAIAKKNAPCILFFDEIDSIAMSRENPQVDDAHRQVLSQLLVEMDGFQKLNNVIMVGATNRPDLLDNAILRPGRFDKLIYMPLPDFEGRKKILSMYLSKLPVHTDIDIDELASKSERYSGADIKALTETVAQIVAQRASTYHKVLAITQDDILNVMKTAKASTTIAQLEQYERFKVDFERRGMASAGNEPQREEVKLDDIIGMDAAKKAVIDAVEIPILHPDLIKKYKIKSVNGVLMFGPPGNGKTMLMRAVSSELKGITMLDLNGHDLTEAGIEKATAALNSIFNRARENAPAIIFIDEIDGIFPSREIATEESVAITSEFLKQIDGTRSLSNVVVVAATNRPDVLDPAVLRPGRFDKLIFVKPPTSSDRAKLFRKILSEVPVAPDISYDKLAEMTRGFTGADIAGVCREAKTAAMERELKSGKSGSVAMDILSQLITATKPSAPDDVVAEYQAFLQKYGQR